MFLLNCASAHGPMTNWMDDWTKGGCELEGSEDLLDVWFNFFIKPFKCTGHMNCARTGSYPQAVSWVNLIYNFKCFLQNRVQGQVCWYF